MKKSKVMVVLALVLTCLMVFAACTSTGGATQESSAPTEEAAAPAETSAAPEESADATAEEESAAPAETEASDADVVVAAPKPEDIQIPDGEEITVGYLSQNQTIQFVVDMGDAIEDEAAKFDGKVKVEMSDAQGVAATQVSQAEDMVVKDVDVVIINAVDGEACAPAVQTIVDAGIPIIVLNTVVANGELATSYVGVDDVEAGVVEMQIMGEALGGEGTINVILGQLGHPASENRWTGVQAEIVEYPGITIGASQAADWDRNKAMNVTEDWISGGANFDGIIALNDEMAISAANALAAANITDVKIVGVDALDEALQLIKDGKMTGSVFQDADSEGRTALDVAVAAAVCMDLGKEYLIPFKAVTAENVDEFLS